MTRKSLKDKLTPGILEALRLRQTSSKSVARLFDVSESYLCRTLADLALVRIPAPTMEQRRTSKMLKAARTYHRNQLAKAVKAKQKTLHQAAREGNCSTRTIHRYMELQK
jgi:predicted DNA-binding transcriptional regulator YafY